jgi:GGDEF domain-containing protein
MDPTTLPTPDERDQQKQLDLTAGFVLGKSPTESKQLQAAKPDWSGLIRNSPVLAERLAAPERALVMQDDVKALEGIERFFGGWRDTPRAVANEWKRGKLTAELSDLGYAQANGYATPEMLKRADEIEKEMESIPQAQQGLITGVPAMMAQSAPLMAQGMMRTPDYMLKLGTTGALIGAGAGAAAGGVGAVPGAGAGFLTGLGVGFTTGTAAETGKAEQGLAYREYAKIPGVTHEQARAASTVVGIVNGALEIVPIEMLYATTVGATAKKLVGKEGRDLIGRLVKGQTGKAALARFAGRIASGAFLEGTTEFLQEMDTILNRPADPLTFDAAWGRGFDAFVGGAQGGGGFGGFNAVLAAKADLNEVAKAKDRQAFFEELGSLTKDSKLRERLSPEFRDYVDRIAEKYGTVDSVSVPAEKLNILFQKEEIDPDTILPDVARQLAGAMGDPQTEIVIPIADFATHIAPLQSFGEIADDVRVKDEFTGREAKEVERRAQQILKDAKVEGEEADPVHAAVKEMLTSAGIAAGAADKYGALWSGFVTSRALRLGMDPLEYFKSINLQIAQTDIIDSVVRESNVVLTPEQLKLKEKALAGDEAAGDLLLEQIQKDELTGGNDQGAFARFVGGFDDQGKPKSPRPGFWLQVDLNDLKKVNDVLGGHPGGNAYLRAMGALVGPAVRGNKGKFFRSGGDELTGWWPAEMEKEARAAVAAVQDAISKAPDVLEGKFRASLSAGFGGSYEAADAALYEAKKGAKEAGRSGTILSGKTPDLTQGDFFFKESPNIQDDMARAQILLQKIDPEDAPGWKKWFKKSVVVDENGKPLIVFHGTTHDFTEFRPDIANPENYHGIGAYFSTDSRDVNQHYGTDQGPDLKTRVEQEYERIIGMVDDPPAYGTPEFDEMVKTAMATARERFVGPGPNIMPVYLSIQNPVVLTPNSGTRFEFEVSNPESDDPTYTSPLLDAFDKVADQFGLGVEKDELRARVVDEIFNGSTAWNIEKVIRYSTDIDSFDTDSEGRTMKYEFIRAMWEAAGFDGIKLDAGAAFPNMAAGGTWHFVPFKPTQIKSALGNRGTYSGRSTNILYQPTNFQGTNFFSAVEEAVKSAKQAKGDAKSWWSVISKTAGVKKEELEWMGVKAWLDALDKAKGRTYYGTAELTTEDLIQLGAEEEQPSLLPPDADTHKVPSIITREQVLKYVQAHKVTIEEEALGAGGGLTDEQREEYRDSLNNLGISVSRSGTSFSYMALREAETDNLDDWLTYHRNETGNISRNDKTEIEELVYVIERLIEDGEEYTDKLDKLNDLLNGTGGSVRVSRYGLRFQGWIDEETEIDDIDEIVDEIADTQGRRDADEARQMMEALSNSDDSDNRQYQSYSLKRDKLTIDGSGREFLFYAPGELDNTEKGHVWEAPHFDSKGKGLLAHTRVAEHMIDGKRVLFIEEIQSDRMQKAREVKRAAQDRVKELEKKIKEHTDNEQAAFDARVAEILKAQAGLNEKGVPGERKAPPTREEWVRENEKILSKWKEEIARLKKVTGFDSVAAVKARLEVTKRDTGREQITFKDPVSGRSTTVHNAPGGVVSGEFTDKAARLIMQEMIDADDAVVDAPLKTVWEEFVVKRLLMYAAEQGIDRVAWTTGEQQSARWSKALREKVAEVAWSKDEGGITLKFIDHSGAEMSGGQLDGFVNTPLTNARAEMIIGADMTKKIDESTDSSGSLKGEDIVVGGVGFRLYYNQSMPSIFEKLLGKFGSEKPKQIEHTGLRETKTKMFTIPAYGATWLEVVPPVIEALKARLNRLIEMKDAVSIASQGTPYPLDAMRRSINALKEERDHRPEEIADVEKIVKNHLNPAEDDLKWLEDNRGYYYDREQLSQLGFQAAFWQAQDAAVGAKIAELEARYELYQEAITDFYPNMGISEPASHDLLSQLDVNTAGLIKAIQYLGMIQEHSGMEFNHFAWVNMALRDGEWERGDTVINPRQIANFNERFKLDESFKTVSREEREDIPGEPVWSVDVPPSFVEHVKDKGLPLFQPGKEGTSEDFRGKTEFDDARKWFKITLTGKANLSTFLHESGHVFLELLHRDAMTGHAQSMEDLAAIYRWLGAKPGEKLTTAQLERFARGFERYLMEGKAPSSKLEAAFENFKSWLVFIYRTLTRLDAPITDEVRAVMDRLVASDEEINKYRAAAKAMPPMPNSTPAQHRAYLAKWAKAVGTRQAALEAGALRDLHTMMRDARKNIQAQVEQEAKGRKDFNAWETLSRGRTLDGSLIPIDIEGKKLKLEELPDRRFRSLTAADGMTAEAMAPYLGYNSGEELIKALKEMPTRTKWIKEQTEARMMEKYPEADLSQIAPRAAKAIHEGGDVAAVLADELHSIDKVLGLKVDKLEKAAIHRAARLKVAEMSQQEMQPGRLLRREMALFKEVEDAIKKGDFRAAREAKRSQLFNHFLYLEVSKAVDEITAIREYLQRFDEMSVRRRLLKAGEMYLNAVDALLEGVEFKRQTNASLERRASLESYLLEMEAAGDIVAVPPKLRAEVGLVNYRQMKLDDLRALRDSIKNIEAQARLKNKLFDGRKERDFRKTTTQLSAHIFANLGRRKPESIGELGWTERALEWVRKGRADLTKIEFLCRALDGGKTAGFAHELIFQPLVEAQARKMDLTKKITEQLMAPLRNMTISDRIRFDKRVDFLGHKLKVKEVIAILLNMGNDGNRMKLLKGFGWSEDAVVKELERVLLPSDLTLVEHFWTTIDKLRPEIEKLTKRQGVEVSWVQPAPITINGITLKGGYYPIVYNRRLAHKAEQIAQRKTGDLWENNFLLPAVEKGFVESRTQFFAPILLSLDVIPSHINEVVHYVTHYEAVRAVDKLTSNKLVEAAITEGLGREQFQLFRPWLQAIAADGVVHEQTDFIDSVLRRFRLGSSIALLGFKVSTGLKQVFGISTTVKEIGPKYVGIGIKLFMEKLAKGRAFADVESAEFQNIDQQHDRDMAQMFERSLSMFSEYGHLKNRFTHMALAWMMLNQKLVNAITWYGAHEKALDELHPDPKAYADSVVRMTQSGGGIKDLAKIQRGSETKRLFVVMYTYFSVMANQLVEPINAKGIKKLPVLAARWWWLVTMPVMLDMLAAGAHPDDGDEPEDYLRLFASEQLRYAGRTVPLGGTLLDAALSDREARYGAWLDTIVKGAAAAGRAARKGDDINPAAVRTLTDLFGAGTGLPTGAAKNGWSYFNQFDSMDEPIQNLLFRPPSQWE